MAMTVRRCVSCGEETAHFNGTCAKCPLPQTEEQLDLFRQWLGRDLPTDEEELLVYGDEGGEPCLVSSVANLTGIPK